VNKIEDLPLPCGHAVKHIKSTSVAVWECSRCAARFISSKLVVSEEGPVSYEESPDSSERNDEVDDEDFDEYEKVLSRVKMPCGHCIYDVSDLLSDVWECRKCKARLLVSDVVVVEQKRAK
jgi:ribosomal protein L37AE/L43A